MNMNEFNNKLIEIGRRYDECIRLKNNLKSIDYDDIVINLRLVKKEKEGFSQGCIERDYLLELINNGKRQVFAEEKPVKSRIYEISQLSEIFPSNKIANTTLVTTCLKGSSLQNSQVKSLILSNTSLVSPKMKTIDLIVQIIKQELEINLLRKQLVPFIAHYIPMTQKNLTVQELKDYLLLGQYSQNGQLSPKNIILGLNGFGGKTQVLEFEFYYKKQADGHKNTPQQEYNSDDDQTLMRINQIISRLTTRVDHFGKQWLINHQ